MRSLSLSLLVLLAVSPGEAIIGPSFLPATVPVGFSDGVYGNATGISSAVAMQFAPDGRLFVCRQNGQLKVYAANTGTFLADALQLTVNTEGERGLLGIAFDPGFATNGFIYLYYTVPSPLHNRISRFTMSGNTANPASELILVDLEGLSANNHNGGAMNIGTDGKLYVAVGDNAVSSNSESIANRLGKILRYNLDGTIPSDNPTSIAGIAGTTSGANRAIWAAGLRNPFTFHINGTQMFINDVGQGSREEVNLDTTGGRTVGKNFGWPDTEGDFNQASFPSYTRPRFAYARGSATTPDLLGNCIAGGAFYPSGDFPSPYHGRYFFADHTAHWIAYLDPAGTGATPFATGLNGPVDLKVRDGILYYLDRGSSSVRRIQYTAAGTAPTIGDQPDSITRAVGQTATFSVVANGSPTLTYRWQKDTTDLNNGGRISGADTATLTITNVQMADAGQYRCRVTNGSGTVNSNYATLTVTANAAPTITFGAPGNGSFYNAGQTINYSATANDAEDGALPASAFSWLIVFHHDAHTHPAFGPIDDVMSGNFTTAATGHLETNVWYRIQCTVTDSAGASTTAFRDIYPNVTTLTIATNPAGLQVTYNGQPHTAPYVVDAVVGMQVQIGAPSPQGAQQFASWAHGGNQTQTITPPATDTTYTANFAVTVTQSVTGLALYNADTDQPIPGFNPIANGATINLATLPPNRTIVATTNPATVGSVVFTYDGAVVATESGAPYCISGDTAGNFNPWAGQPTLGAHTLTATPYTAAAGGGSAGTALTRSFTVVNTPPPGGGGPPPPQGDPGTGVDEKCFGAVGAGLPWDACLLGALAAAALSLRRRRAKA